MSRIEPSHHVTPCDGQPEAGRHARPAAAAPQQPLRHALRWAQRLLLAVGVCLVAPGFAAEPEPGEPPAPVVYPSAQAAQAAADAAKAEQTQAVGAYEARVRECMKTFFVNRCLEKARTERNEKVERAEDTRQRAELFVRQEKSRVHREQLAAENAQRDVRDAEKAAHARAQQASRAPEVAPARPAPEPGAPVPAQRPAPREDDAAERARNRAAYDRKQEEARVYAEKQAERRKENEEKRARRREQREAEAARMGRAAEPPAAQPAAPGAAQP